MTNDQKGVLERAKKHGAFEHTHVKYDPPNSRVYDNAVTFPGVENLGDFAASLEEKWKAAIKESCDSNRADMIYEACGGWCSGGEKAKAVLEEKHRAKIAMLVKVAIRAANKLSHLYAVMHLTDGFNPAQIASLQTIRAAIDRSISATQQDTEAFLAEVRAKERNRIATWMDANSISHISANWLRSPSAELRASAAQPEGKEVK